VIVKAPESNISQMQYISLSVPREIESDRLGDAFILRYQFKTRGFCSGDCTDCGLLVCGQIKKFLRAMLRSSSWWGECSKTKDGGRAAP
jgi:hypothetical protein